MSRGLSLFLASASLSVLTGPAAALEPGAVSIPFQIRVAADIDVMDSGQAKKLTIATEVAYTWQRQGNEKRLILESTTMKSHLGDDELTNTSMSRKKWVTVNKGKIKEITFDAAPDDIKLIMRKFGSPICNVELDASGRERNRTVLAVRGKDDLIDGGVIGTTLVCHPMYFSDKESWEAEAELGTVTGGAAGGKLRYKKISGGKGEQLVSVTGALTSGPVAQADGTSIRYTVHGKHGYNPMLKEWVTGKITMDLVREVKTKGEATTIAKGTITVILTKLP